jgi:hypothetical protein
LRISSATGVVFTGLCLSDVVIVLHFLQGRVPFDLSHFSLPGLMFSEGIGGNVGERVINIVIIHRG